jgi:hypothetical protein
MRREAGAITLRDHFDDTLVPRLKSAPSANLAAAAIRPKRAGAAR